MCHPGLGEVFITGYFAARLLIVLQALEHVAAKMQILRCA